MGRDGAKVTGLARMRGWDAPPLGTFLATCGDRVPWYLPT